MSPFNEHTFPGERIIISDLFGGATADSGISYRPLRAPQGLDRFQMEGTSALTDRPGTKEKGDHGE